MCLVRDTDFKKTCTEAYAENTPEAIEVNCCKFSKSHRLLPLPSQVGHLLEVKAHGQNQLVAAKEISKLNKIYHKLK